MDDMKNIQYRPFSFTKLYCMLCMYVCMCVYTILHYTTRYFLLRMYDMYTYTNINLHNMIQTNYLIYVYLVHLSSNKGYTIFLIHTHTAHTHTLHSHTYWHTHTRIYTFGCMQLNLCKEIRACKNMCEVNVKALVNVLNL